MKKFYVIAAIITFFYICSKVTFPDAHPPEDIDNQPEDIILPDTTEMQILPENEEMYLSIEDEVIICLAYVEDYKSTSYFCGSRWTIGYGSTTYANGERVKPGEQITKLDAQKCARSFLRKYVFPYIDKYVTKPLTRQEIIGISMFIYNVGPGNFIKSDFLQALNEGMTPFETTRRMTQFTKSAGRFAPGLLKREWVQSAIYCEYITPYELLELTPAGFYNYGIGEFFINSYPSWDGYYNYKLNSDFVEDFLRKNKATGTSVYDII